MAPGNISINSINNGILDNLLRTMSPTGPNGFEGLIARLLEALTERSFYLSRSGAQGGRDISARSRNANVTAIECKRYGDTSLDIRDLQGTMVQAVQDIPDLDLWVLVTSRSVDSQLHERLQRTAIERSVDYFAISMEDGDPSTLEVLLAQAPDITSEFFREEHHHELQPVLLAIAEHPSYSQRLQYLKDELNRPSLGYENWRIHQNLALNRHFSSERESRAHFGQSINVTDESVHFVERSSVSEALDNWYNGWSNSQTPLMLLGNEGDGKTWSVAAWIARKIQSDTGFAPVVFFSSLTVSSDEPLDLLSEAISRQLSNQEQSSNRISRWVHYHPLNQPSFVVVLDGINERRSFQFWQGLMERFYAEPCLGHVALILTCRTEYWNRRKAQIYIPFTEIQISPYNDEELAQALASHNLSSTLYIFRAR